MRAGWAAALLVTALPALAAAQPEAGVDAARAEMDRGLAAARAGDWETARDAFAHAWELAPRPLMLLNLGSAEIRTGRLVDAAATYQRFLDVADDSVTDSHRQTAREALEELDTRTPRVRVRVIGGEDDDRVDLDDRLDVERDTDLAIDPGEHTASLVRDGEAIAEQRFAIGERERRDVLLAVGDAATEVPLLPTEEPTGLERVVRSPITWVAVGAVLLTLVLVAALAGGGTEAPVGGSFDPPILRVP